MQNQRDTRNHWHYTRSSKNSQNTSAGAVRIQVLQETTQDESDFDPGTIQMDAYKVRFDTSR